MYLNYLLDCQDRTRYWLLIDMYALRVSLVRCRNASENSPKWNLGNHFCAYRFGIISNIC